jgi:hypothetical protein
MQHVNIKLFAGQPAQINLHDAIPVFHRWIQTGAIPGLLIDVADYAHVPAGPGVLLIAHEFNLGLDQAKNRLGLLYNRKAVLNGGPLENLQSVYEAAAFAAGKLETEPEFRGRLRFKRDEIQVIFNDRLLYPNTEETWLSAEPALRTLFDSILKTPNYLIRRDPDPRSRLTVTARLQ